MGNKSDRSRNNISFYIAACCLTAAVNLTACAPFREKISEIKAHQQLQQYREDLAEGFFETIIEQSMQIIEENETEPPADVALYALGEVFAHHDYQGRDYYLSQYYFDKLIENFPDSELSAEAKTYKNLLETIIAQERKAKDQEKKSASVEPPAKIAGDHNFQKAIQKNLLVLEKVGKKKPADEALYNLGLIYAHTDNPAKDYKKSRIYFHVLSKQFPESEFTEEAQVILGLFDTIDKIQQIDVDIEQQKKEFIR